MLVGAVTVLVFVAFGVIALTGLFESHSRKGKVRLSEIEGTLYRVWVVNHVEPAGGFWWYGIDNGDGFLRQLNFDYTGREDQLVTLEELRNSGECVELVVIGKTEKMKS
jgi:hypothetical protein